MLQRRRGPRYSWTIVNVGLDTSSGRSRALGQPAHERRLAAPSGPSSSTTSPALERRGRASRPTAVGLGFRVRRHVRRSRLRWRAASCGAPSGPAPRRPDGRRCRRRSAPTSPSSASARSPARPCRYTRERARPPRRRATARPCRDHAGQHVARARRRHAGIAGQVDERLAVRRRDDRAVALSTTCTRCVAAKSRATPSRCACTSSIDSPVERAPSRRDAA